MPGFDTVVAQLRAGAAIRRKSWPMGHCITSPEPGAGPVFVDGSGRKPKIVKGDAIPMSDIAGNDWETCDVPDFGRSEPKKSKGKPADPPKDPMGGGGAHENTGDL